MVGQDGVKARTESRRKSACSGVCLAKNGKVVATCTASTFPMTPKMDGRQEVKVGSKVKTLVSGLVPGKQSPICNDTEGSSKERESKAMKRTVTRLKLKALEEARQGLYYPLSPRTVEKRWRTKERIRKITGALKVSPRVFERGAAAAKEWRVHPSACESKVVRRIREKLHDRRAGMKVFTSNKIFDRILEVSEEEEKLEDPVKASIASKFEYMARELIDKTAYLQAREQHGVWSRTGIPYTCLAVPALNRPATAPLPQLDKLQDDSFAIYPFDFFPIPSNTASMLELAGEEVPKPTVSLYITRREAVLKAARRGSTMSRLLMKMGLLHLHDMDNAKFPHDQILFTDSLKKKVKKGGSWLEEIPEGMMNAIPRVLSVVPYTGRTVVGPAGNIERFGDTNSSSSKSGDDPKHANAGKDSMSHRHSVHRKSTIQNISWLKRPEHVLTHESFVLCQSDTKEILIEPEPTPVEVDWKPDQAFVFNLKKGNLWQRKTMLYDLSWKLTAISDRRTHWRSFLPFSAEICKRIEALLFATKGRRTPATQHLWKIVEQRHPIKRELDVPAHESEVQSIKRFYERVCRFIDHQKMADPLMDILVYFLKEIFEVEGLRLQPEVLLRLCERLAGIPEEVANSGRMICIMPILQFIAKELRLNSTEFDEYIMQSGVNRMQPSV